MLSILNEFSASERRWLVVLSAAAAVSAIALDLRIALWSSKITDSAQHILAYVTDAGLSIWYLVPSLFLFPVCLICSRLSSRIGIIRFYRWGAETCGFFFAAIFLSGLAVNIIKIAVGRARPHLFFEKGITGIDPPGLDAAWRSFPSGHASTLIALALAAGYFLPRHRVLFLIVGALLASTRVLVNAHFVSDVLFAGAVSLFVTSYLQRWCAKRNFAFRTLGDATIELKPEAKVISIMVGRIRKHLPGQ